MNAKEQRSAAKKFAEKWAGRGDEKSDTQLFWINLLQDVFGVENIQDFIIFEDRVKLQHTSFIDARIPSTKVLIEQKSITRSLTAPYKQSDNSLLTPYQQAKKYIVDLPRSEHPRWVVTCNFKEFYIYDMEKPTGDPEIIKLEDLQDECYRLQFLVEDKESIAKQEMKVSLQAGELVGELYDALLKQYADPEDEQSLKALNMLCVRLVFCLYAEDAGIFGRRGMFHDYLAAFEARHLRKALIELFQILDQRPEERGKYLDPELAAFPYVNGGLFEDENIEIPMLTDEIKDLLLNRASRDFDWSAISPTIFGAVFESTLNPETRRGGGMHYTPIETIHKVIDPLFLNELTSELEEIRSISVIRTKEKRLKLFQQKLSELVIFDPACGSGNFLTESYISLRRLENEALISLMECKKKEYDTQIMLGLGMDVLNPIQVDISQFYGIEINDFAVSVAKTALWIAEAQMMDETAGIVHMDMDFLPLKSYTKIKEGNALRMDWEDVVPKDRLSYIIGNPPFVGYKYQDAEQKKDIRDIFHTNKHAGVLDYVACWYKKAADLMNGTEIRTALISTNSITQGESVGILWKQLFSEHVVIEFAHTTFVWTSDAAQKAHVHCVIIGFNKSKKDKTKILYSNGFPKKVSNINGYLMDAPNVAVEKRRTPLQKVPHMAKGSQLIDGGNFTVGSKKDVEVVLHREPELAPYIKQYFNAQKFLNKSEEQYVLDLNECPPHLIIKSDYLTEKVEAVRKYREETSDFSRQLSDTPAQYYQYISPKKKSIIIPQASSERRRYVPMGFAEEGMIYTNQLLFIDNATPYHFGVLESNVHMAWMRTVCGRLKSDYRYSKDIVYNNFPWPDPTPEQKAKIEETAQAILDARALYPESSLADMYGEKMRLYTELHKAHQENDKAVMTAYGFTTIEDGKKRWLRESETVAELMKMYQKLTEK